MLTIGKREFLQLFKGFKSILLILVFLVTSYYSAKFADGIAEAMELTAQEAGEAHLVGLLFLVMFFGHLFVASLSHDSINKEIRERTMRFLVTKTTRFSIIVGKFLGIWMFWFVCLFLSFLIIALTTEKIDFLVFTQTMSLLTLQISFILLMSVLINKPGATMFLGILGGILLPILGGWFVLTSNPAISWLKYVSPFYYLDLNEYSFLVLLVVAGILIYLTNLLFKRREC
ncbi:hypothetical protein C2I17_04850 [Niallia circulans]|uniref:ABC transporter permease n=1 Tax=Niallia circulans TaxID=1397 RepID=UPI00201E0387|nr:ABC transporter permease subunit [Niallia circulans]UQZ73949.1 hypothetical protein C2I17_04850 [Niallia circulans]